MEDGFDVSISDDDIGKVSCSTARSVDDCGVLEDDVAFPEVCHCGSFGGQSGYFVTCVPAAFGLNALMKTVT